MFLKDVEMLSSYVINISGKKICVFFEDYFTLGDVHVL